MPTLDSQDILEKKIDSLERQVKTMKFTGVILLSSIFLMAPTSDNFNTNPNITKPAGIGHINAPSVSPKNARFATVVVDKLLIKDRSGKKVLLELGRENISHEMTENTQSGSIKLKRANSTEHITKLNAEEITTSGNNAFSTINNGRITVKSKANRLALSSSNIRMTHGNLVTAALSGTNRDSYLKLKYKDGSSFSAIAGSKSKTKIVLKDADNKKVSIGNNGVETGLWIEDTSGTNSIKAVLDKSIVPVIELSNNN